MEVIMKIGAYAGQVRDVQAIYARGLIERGEAIDPNAPLEFATGGIVEMPASVLVGEVVSDFTLPLTTVAKLETALKATAKAAKRGRR